jgi:hypothetical protein
MVGGPDHAPNTLPLSATVAAAVFTAGFAAFAGCLMLGVLGVLAARAVYGRADADWAFMRNAAFPMGISIAGAGLTLSALSLVL